MRKYKFSWDLIGDITIGRPNLGATVDLDVYRLMQFAMRDVLEEHYGTETTDKIFYTAGKLAGKHFYESAIKPVSNVDEFVSKVQKTLIDKRIGILRVEESAFHDGRVILTVDEDLDCSGLPEIDFEACIYDEGFIAALFECFTSESWKAEEIDCWSTGARTCRFLVTQEDMPDSAAT